MVTATLLAKGVPMAEAYKAARDIRDAMRGYQEVSAADIEAAIAPVVATFTKGGVKKPRKGGWRVRTADGTGLFERHVLIRDLVAAGLDVTDAAELTRALENQFRSRGPTPRHTLVDAVVQVLLKEDEVFARRYQLIEHLRDVQIPVVLLIGGATGTGKSTLAMELAFRLGIRRVVSTDMIRETMRTVLSADVVPGLHDHSFRGMLQGGQVLSDPRERVLAGFRQQVSQVAAGVRSVIRRALREHSHLVVEGTHIVPGLRYVPAELPATSARMMLAVPQAKRHKARFPRRAATQQLRDAAAYLDAFQSVRWIHDDLMAEAETVGSPVLASEDKEELVLSMMDYLSHTVLDEAPPALPSPAELSGIRRNGPKTLFMIIDGLPDEPHPLLDNRTPLAAASTPYLSRLASLGGLGQIITAPEGELPHTDTGLWALLGAEAPKARIGRGIFEAVGTGVPLSAGAVVLRGNLATKGTGETLIDRRAGRITEGVVDLLADLRQIQLSGGIQGNVYPGHEHRVVVMLRGPGLSAAVSDTDPGSKATIQRARRPRPTDETPEAARTAAALRELLGIVDRHLTDHPANVARAAHGLLPANCIITRGAASTANLPSPNPHLGEGVLVAACPTALGVGRLIGLQGLRGPTMTANLDTDFNAKFEAAAAMLKDRPLVVVHFKGTDIAGHERRPLAKRDYITRLDAALGRFLGSNSTLTTGLRVVVSADHGTSSITGHHLIGPVPVLVATWDGGSGDTDDLSFDEETAAGGALGVLQPGELSQMLWS